MYTTGYRAFSLTWSVAMQIYLNKRKLLLDLRSVPNVRCTHDFTFLGIIRNNHLLAQSLIIIYLGHALRLRCPYQPH